MNLKKHKNNDKLKSISVLATMILIGCSLVFQNAIQLSAIEKLDDTEDFYTNIDLSVTPKSADSSTIRVYLLSINQTHTNRGKNLTFTGYVEKVSGIVQIDPLILSYSNESGIDVFPIIDGHACDGSDGNTILYPNLTTKTSNINGDDGQFSFSYQVDSSYDIDQNMIINANCTTVEADNTYFGPDSIMNSSFVHDITVETFIDIDTNILSPLYDGNIFYVNYSIIDNLGTSLDFISENITIYRNNSLGDELLNITEYNVDYLTQNVSISYTRGTTDIGVHFNGINETLTNGETYYQYGECNASTVVEYLTARVFLLSMNQTHTLRGNSFTYSGYTQQLINNQFVNMTGIEVYPIIDGNHLPGNSIISGSDGLFSFTVNVAADYDNTVDMTLNANITENIGDNVIVGVSSIANSSLIQDITSRTNLSILIDNSIPKLIGDEFDLEITLTDELGGIFTIPTNRFELYRNRNLTSTLSQTGINIEALDSTVLIQNIVQENGMEHIGVHFLGVPTTKPGQSYLEYQAFNASTFIRRVQAINGSFSFANAVRNTTLPYVFTQGDVFLNGTISMDENYTVVSQTVDFYLNGQFIGYTETNAEGYFEFTFNLAEEGFAVNTSIDACVITLNLRNMDSEYLGSNTSTSINTITLTIEDGVPYVAPTNTSLIAGDVPLKWMNIVYVGLGVVALVVGLVIFQRQRMDRSSKRDRKLRKVDYSRFENVNVLYNQGRRREAIAYTYKIFADLINEKYGLVREEHETIRVFAITCVTKYGLDPMRTYPYLALVENIVYGFYDLNLEAFKKSMLVFGRVFQEITGTMLEFTLIESSDGGLESEQTLKIGAVSE
ncbi:hypothetical protein NEF87_004457 [Candidatus Lokiarchaeum ossiferum]|uniref:DUF4129 domain-containing protein n=1 Tax=Candidatus Lokiarchaeum ossiferum TaxID=2951803 RepID=A0ABY6I0R2_9ARCH|nr:hypothetical protein NEF87_004457 [Candidatus Lokiarchaeum sp. B-35]